MTRQQPSRNPFFPFLILSGGLFVVTIFAFIAAPLGDPAAPLAKALERHGWSLIGGEVGTILLVGIGAMALDRLQARRNAAAAPDRRVSNSAEEGK